MTVHRENHPRPLEEVQITADLIVTGGGLSGICCALAAAREGMSTVLVQDRSILGGNSSSEVRLWALGATSHMGNNNRWAREGGIIGEILEENLWRNREGNPVIFDALLLDKVKKETNIRLLLDTAVFHAHTRNSSITSVTAFCSQNSTLYNLDAPCYCDASGDGILGYLSGADFRVGAEKKEEYNEPLAPDEEYGELLGHTIYFYSKDTGKPVKYTPPEFALKDITRIPHHHKITAKDHGCSFWWLEYGGRMDTVRDSQEIKQELWNITYGIWDYIKNSGKFPEAKNMTLEWVGMIPGKRESRRMMGDYILTQKDIVRQINHYDAVSHGGWAIDLHPADGVYSDKPSCTQYHSLGAYQIPYRCLYSRNVENLFLAGRLISASHVAFGSTRVMLTCGVNGQAVGTAAALCRRMNFSLRELGTPENIVRLQSRLKENGQFIPHVELPAGKDRSIEAEITASSQRWLEEMVSGRESINLDIPRGMLLPLEAGAVPRISFIYSSSKPADLEAKLYLSSYLGNTSCDSLVEARQSYLPPAERGTVSFTFDHSLDQAQYALIALTPNPDVRIFLTEERLTGILSLCLKGNDKVARGSRQVPPEDSGVDEFDFWLPERRPEGKNIAFTLDPPLGCFSPENLKNNWDRPFIKTNTWIADTGDEQPYLIYTWKTIRRISYVVVNFDGDFDHPMESVQMGHPEEAVPFCVRDFSLQDETGKELAHVQENHNSRVRLTFSSPLETRFLKFIFHKTWGAPVSVFSIRVYE